MVMGSQQSEAVGYRVVRSKFPIANRLGAADLDEPSQRPHLLKIGESMIS
jgi:hypothetical protein